MNDVDKWAQRQKVAQAASSISCSVLWIMILVPVLIASICFLSSLFGR